MTNLLIDISSVGALCIFGVICLLLILLSIFGKKNDVYVEEFYTVNKGNDNNVLDKVMTFNL